jgi:ABC-type transporter Mla subunit MlaD
MADLDFDQIPAQEQMVDNWGQPTPWMQALWQRLTEQIRAQIADVAEAASAAQDAADQAAAAANDATEALSQAAAILGYLLDLADYQTELNNYLIAIAGILLELLTVLDDPTQPLSPAVVPASFTDFAALGAGPPIPPAPP